jgi:hypothetical protein
MAKKIILCDLDETLINREYELTVPIQVLISAIQAKQSNGCLIGLNSDTPLPALRNWADRFGMQGPLLCEKGQLLSLSPNGAAEVYGTMSAFFHQLRQQVIVRAHEEIPGAFVGIGDVTEFIIRQGRVFGVDRCAVLINGYRQCSFSGYALASHNGRLGTQDLELYKRFCDLVFSIIGDDQKYLDEPDQNQYYGILVLHEKGASKNHAVERLIEQIDDNTEVIMIGDADADIISIKHKIKLCAVSNASPSLKAKAQETGGIIASKAFTEGVVEILSLL